MSQRMPRLRLVVFSSSPLNSKLTLGLQLRRAISIHAAFRFLAGFFFSYSACRLSISLFGTEISCFASFSKREYSSDGGLVGLLFFTYNSFRGSLAQLAERPNVLRERFKSIGVWRVRAPHDPPLQSLRTALT